MIVKINGSVINDKTELVKHLGKSNISFFNKKYGKFFHSVDIEPKDGGYCLKSIPKDLLFNSKSEVDVFLCDSEIVFYGSMNCIENITGAYEMIKNEKFSQATPSYYIYNFISNCALEFRIQDKVESFPELESLLSEIVVLEEDMEKIKKEAKTYYTNIRDHDGVEYSVSLWERNAISLDILWNILNSD